MWVTYTESKVILELEGPSIQSFVCVCVCAHIFSVDLKISSFPHFATYCCSALCTMKIWGAVNEFCDYQ